MLDAALVFVLAIPLSFRALLPLLCQRWQRYKRLESAATDNARVEMWALGDQDSDTEEAAQNNSNFVSVLLGVAGGVFASFVIAAILVVVLVYALQDQVVFPAATPASRLACGGNKHCSWNHTKSFPSFAVSEIVFLDESTGNRLHGLLLHNAANTNNTQKPNAAVCVIHPSGSNTLHNQHTHALIRGLLALNKFSSVFAYDLPTHTQRNSKTATKHSIQTLTESAALSAAESATLAAARATHAQMPSHSRKPVHTKLVHVGFGAVASALAVHAVSVFGARSLVLHNPVTSLDAVVMNNALWAGSLVCHLLRFHLDSGKWLTEMDQENIPPKAVVVVETPSVHTHHHHAFNPNNNNNNNNHHHHHPSSVWLGSSTAWKEDARVLCDKLAARGCSCDFVVLSSPSLLSDRVDSFEPNFASLFQQL